MSSTLSLQRAPALIGGPMLVGACFGLQTGLLEALEASVAVPAVLVGVALLMAPALYIGAAFLGVAPAARDAARAVGAALADAGLLMLGLVPAFAFLLATSGDVALFLLTHLVVLTSVAVALLALRRRLFAGSGRPIASTALFLLWALVGLGIGERLFLEALFV